MWWKRGTQPFYRLQTYICSCQTGAMSGESLCRLMTFDDWLLLMTDWLSMFDIWWKSVGYPETSGAYPLSYRIISKTHAEGNILMNMLIFVSVSKLGSQRFQSWRNSAIVRSLIHRRGECTWVKYLLKRLHQFVSKHLGRKGILPQSSGVWPRLQFNFSANGSSKTMTPLHAGEMSGHVLDRRVMNTFRISTGII